MSEHSYTVPSGSWIPQVLDLKGPLILSEKYLFPSAPVALLQRNKSVPIRFNNSKVYYDGKQNNACRYLQYWQPCSFYANLKLIKQKKTHII